MSAFVSPQYSLEQNLPNSTPAPVVETRISLATSPLLEAPKSPIPSRPAVPGVLKRIAFCESGGRQYDENGNVVRGVVNKYDTGKYQINTQAWGQEAKKLGYDLMTEEGNEAMALAIYKRYGTSPWIYSSPCWSTTN